MTQKLGRRSVAPACLAGGEIQTNGFCEGTLENVSLSDTVVAPWLGQRPARSFSDTLLAAVSTEVLTAT